MAETLFDWGEPLRESGETPAYVSLTNAVHGTARDIFNAKENYLRSMQILSGLSEEEFARLYIFEEYPVETEVLEDFPNNEYSIVFHQKFRVRRKTPEELALEEQA